MIRRSRDNGVQNRIDRLESLVTKLLLQSDQQKPSEHSPQSRTGSDSGVSTRDHESVTKVSSSDYDQVENGMGTMKVDEYSSVYRGATHWDDVFREVSVVGYRMVLKKTNVVLQLHDLKNEWNQVQGTQFDNEVAQLTSSETAQGPSILCGPGKTIELSELLATLPGKSAVDKLIAKFFDPSSTPVMRM